MHNKLLYDTYLRWDSLLDVLNILHTMENTSNNDWNAINTICVYINDAISKNELHEMQYYFDVLDTILNNKLPKPHRLVDNYILQSRYTKDIKKLKYEERVDLACMFLENINKINDTINHLSQKIVQKTPHSFVFITTIKALYAF